MCDKRFLLVLKFADYAVEPFYYERSVDFYENGQNYAMASLLSVAGPTLLGQTAFDALLASFQHAVKEKTPEALNALVSAARATRWRELPEALGPLAQYAAPECLSAVANPGVNTDAAFVVLQIGIFENSCSCFVTSAINRLQYGPRPWNLKNQTWRRLKASETSNTNSCTLC